MDGDTAAGRRRESMRAALEGIADEAISTEGLAGLSYRRFARDAGCSVGTAFNLLGNADELTYRLNTMTLDAIRERAEGSLATAADAPAARFEALATAYVDYALGHERRWRALFDFAPTSDEPEGYLAARGRLFGIIEVTVRDLPGVGAAAAPWVARSLWAAIHGVVIVGLNGNRGLMAREEVRSSAIFLARSLSVGLAAAPA